MSPFAVCSHRRPIRDISANEQFHYSVFKEIEFTAFCDSVSLSISAEYQDLTDDNAARNDELESVKDELKQLRSIRYYVSKVLPEEAEPEKVSVSDRLTEGRLQSDRKAAEKDPEQPLERKQAKEH